MILIVAATPLEVKPIIPSLNTKFGEITSLSNVSTGNVDLLVSGIGGVPMAFHLTKALLSRDYAHVINIGIAGSFSKDIGIGEVVVVDSDTFADYGIDDNGLFKNLFQIKLSNPNEKPFDNGWLNWSHNEEFTFAKEFKRVKAITVETSSGSDDRIANVITQYNPEIETMEGAAVFYSCLQLEIPFICLRGISNYVEPRKIGNWNIEVAVENVCMQAIKVIDSIK